MKAKVLSMMVAAAFLAWPTVTSACTMKIGYLFMNMPSSPWVAGGGANIEPGTDGEDTYWTANVDAMFGLGERFMAQPAIGYCSGGDDGEIVFGGALGLNLWNNADGSVMVNVQGAVTHASFEGDFSEQTFPISAQALFAAGESASIFGGAGLQVNRDSFDGESDTESDPFVDFGIQFGESFLIQIGGSLKFGEDHDGDTSTDFAINVGGSVGIG